MTYTVSSGTLNSTIPYHTAPPLPSNWVNISVGCTRWESGMGPTRKSIICTGRVTQTSGWHYVPGFEGRVVIQNDIVQYQIPREYLQYRPITELSLLVSCMSCSACCRAKGIIICQGCYSLVVCVTNVFRVSEVSEQGLTSPSTHSGSFWRRVFPVNHIHWYWQLNKKDSSPKWPIMCWWGR